MVHAGNLNAIRLFLAMTLPALGTMPLLMLGRLEVPLGLVQVALAGWYGPLLLARKAGLGAPPPMPRRLAIAVTCEVAALSLAAVFPWTFRS